MLEERGVSVANSDAIARDVLWEKDVQAQLMSHFSTVEPLTPVLLKSLISEGDDNRRAVNRIMHPHVAYELSQAEATVFEVPLLFETCLHTSFDAIWMAFCSPETQSKRLADRYGNQAQFPQLNWQLDSKVGMAFSDSVIPTDSDEEETLETLLQEAKRWQLPLVVS